MSDMLIENILKEYGEDVANNISNDMAYKSTICILYVADVREKTPEAFEKECQAYHLRYPQRDIENYKKLMAMMYKDKFSFTIEPMGYFIDEKSAEEAAISNLCDINEAGAFPYVILSQVCLNHVYPFGDNDETKRLFLFNINTRQYEEIAWDTNEATKALFDRGSHGAF